MSQFEPPPAALPGPAAHRRIRVLGLAAGLVVAVLVALGGASLSQPLYDLFQGVVPTPDVSRRVHVVVVDAESLREVGGWPWSRFYMARLVEEIAERGAVAIGIDVLLPERDRSDPADFARLYAELPPAAAGQVARLPSMDAVFARVVGRNPVVLARAGVRPGSFDDLEQTQAPLPPAAHFEGAPPPRLLVFPKVVANLPIIDGAGMGHGLVNGDRDPDGVVRRVPLAARAAGPVTPGFALELVRVAQRAHTIAFRNGEVCAGRACVPSGPDGQLVLRFGDWRETPTTSAVNLMRQGMPADLFKGQIVIVGVTSAGIADVAGTPRARAVSGVFVQAQAVDAILRGSGLTRPVWAPILEWSLAVAGVLTAWLGVPRALMRTVIAAALLLAAAALAGSALAFSGDLLVDPIPMIAPGAATAAAMLVLLVIEGRRAEARLEAALEGERRIAERRQTQLVNELNHRVKNTLATVQSMAVQTMRPHRTPEEARDAFVERLMALNAAHNLLNEVHWGAADLGTIVRTVVAPYDDIPGARFRIDGPPVPMQASHALAFALALQELGSNALKFGALSTPTGRIRISWRAIDGGRIEFRWVETGGPALAEATVGGGFGTRLIRQGLARDLGGEVRLMPRPTGLTCEIVFRPD
ncbi:CHASE2 domain-containing protein [Phenylobacterium sp.]|uniref:CHASE2 domain-containing protein n=1 Tax=Phenylobacterium sp. TaxID=1871053 RepID=UPI002ED85222